MPHSTLSTAKYYPGDPEASQTKHGGPHHGKLGLPCREGPYRRRQEGGGRKKKRNGAEIAQKMLALLAAVPRITYGHLSNARGDP